MLGTVDPAQADDLAAHPDRYVAGDLVGHGGLQGRYDERLRGAPGLTVVIRAPPAEGGTLASTGTEVFRAEPKRRPAGQDHARRGHPERGRRRAARPRSAGRRWSRCGSATARCSPRPTAPARPGRTWPSPPRCRRAPPSRWSARSACWTGARSRRTRRWTARRPSPSTVGRSRTPTTSSWARCRSAPTSPSPATPRSPRWPRKLGPDGLAGTGRALGLEGNWDLGARRLHRQGLAPAAARPSRPPRRSARAPPLVSPLAMAGGHRRRRPGPLRAAEAGARPGPGPARRGRPASCKAGVGGGARTMMREVVTAGTGSALAGRAGRPGVRQDRHRRVRRQPGAHPRLVRRLAGGRRVRRLRREGRGQHGHCRPDRRALPPRPRPPDTRATSAPRSERPRTRGVDRLGFTETAVSEPPGYRGFRETESITAGGPPGGSGRVGFVVVRGVLGRRGRSPQQAWAGRRGRADRLRFDQLTLDRLPLDQLPLDQLPLERGGDVRCDARLLGAA